MKNYYLDNDWFESLLKKWQSGTISDDENNELGKILMTLHERIANSSAFRRYDYHTKNDMISSSLVKIMKSLQFWKYEIGKAFSYFTKSVYNNYFRFLYDKKKQKEKFDRYQSELTQLMEDYHEIEV